MWFKSRGLKFVRVKKGFEPKELSFELVGFTPVFPTSNLLKMEPLMAIKKVTSVM